MSVSTIPGPAGRDEWKELLSSPCGVVGLLVLVHAALSIAVSTISLINDDGILYIRIARLVAQGQYSEAAGLYKWPTYPFLIGAVSWITGIDTLLVARALNISASVVTLLILLNVLRRVTQEQVVLVCAGLLLLSHLWWNSIRGVIVREHFFLMFMSAGLLFQTQDLVRARWTNKAGFLLSGILAALFRIEAAAFVVLVPLFQLVTEANSVRARVRYGVIAIIGIALAIAPYGLVYLSGAGQVQGLWAGIFHKMEILRTGVLAPWSASRWLLGYLAMVLGLATYGFVVATGPILIALAAYNIRHEKSELERRWLRLAACYVAVGAIVALVFVFLTLYYEPRYGLLVSLVVALAAAPGLARLYQRFRSAQRDKFTTAFAVITAVLMLYGLLAGTHLYERRNFVRTAAAWVSANIPPMGRILSNDNQIMFYAGLPPADPELLLKTAIAPSIAGFRNWQSYDSVVLYIRENRPNFIDEVTREFGAAPVAMFENSRGDRIVVFRH